jgi:hypothetical protein
MLRELVTLKNISIKLNLTQATISKVLRDYPDLSPGTINLTLRAADEPGYVHKAIPSFYSCVFKIFSDVNTIFKKTISIIIAMLIITNSSPAELLACDSPILYCGVPCLQQDQNVKAKKEKKIKEEKQVKKEKKDGGNKKTIQELIAANPPVKYVKGYVGKKYPAEWKEFPALVEGYKVLQLTTSPAEDSKFYLTTDSYFPALNSVAFVSNRTGTWNVFYCSFDNGELTQVTDFPKSVKDDGHGDLCVPKTNDIIYYDKKNSVLRKVNLVTFKDTELYTMPDGFKVGNSLTASADGSTIAITAIKGEKGDVEVSKMIFVKTDGTGVTEITRPGQQLSHVNLSTAGSKPGVIYARKEIEDNKMFFYMSLDGKVDKKIIEAKGKDEGVSHPFWTPDGSKACYLKKLKGKNPKYWLGYYDINEDKNYEFEKVQDNDMGANYNSTIFVGTGSAIDPCLKFWRLENGKLVATRMFEHGATFPGPECRDVHNTFIAGTNNVIFNADGDGNGNVYVLIEKK